MEITQIKHNPMSGIDSESIKTFEALQNVSKTQAIEETFEPSSISWKKKILLDALDVLEDNIQVDNNHPLSREGYMPIESYEEALIELNFLQDSTFRKDASASQANANPAFVLELFADEKSFFKIL